MVQIIINDNSTEISTNNSTDNSTDDSTAKIEMRLDN